MKCLCMTLMIFVLFVSVAVDLHADATGKETGQIQYEMVPARRSEEPQPGLPIPGLLEISLVKTDNNPEK